MVGHLVDKGEPMAELELEGVCKSFGDQKVVHGVDLTVNDGEFVVLVGPSGCGKSTILRMIAGLEDITAGTVKIGQRTVNDLPAKDRNLAMVFQDYALYPNMTVAANMGFGLKMNGLPKADRDRRVREVAELLQLTPYLDRKPKALSGGQRQRVAMGRALARSAVAFLFDEPLSNLDAKLRLEVRTQIKLLHQQLGMTSIFVTHDQTEAMTMADRIVCLETGRIAQVGTPDELYNHPTSVFVATFIGSPPINLLEATAQGHSLRLADGQSLTLPEDAATFQAERRVLVGIRPEDLTDRGRLGSAENPLKLTMRHRLTETLGSDSYMIGEISGQSATARCTPGIQAMNGAEIELFSHSSKIHLFDPETKTRI